MGNKKILVTGADGFIGSHLVEMLIQKGYQVRALSQYNSFGSWGWLETIDCLDQIEVLNGDIRDLSYCRFISKDIDTIYHLAALISIPFSYTSPESYVATNIQGTVNICQAGLDNSIGRVIHTSTSEVYGTAQYVPIDENHPKQPQSPYSATKIAADAMAMSFYNTFDLPLVIARPFNTYGPRQSARAVIPTIISQIAAGMKNIKLGDLTPTRDFTYVEDTCRGLLCLGDSEKTIGKTVNIGSNTEISIGDLVNLISNLMESKVEILKDEDRIRPAKSEVNRLLCDNNLLYELTGFKPRINIEDGLKETISWLSQEENLRRYKFDLYNV
jgi:NAD dependent epimerase/dehydratase